MQMRHGSTVFLPLTRRGDFVRATKTDLRFVTPGFAVQLLPLAAPVSNLYHVGFTASKKFSKHAVDRNRAKRRLREVIRLTLPDCAPPDYACVLVARKAVLGLPFAQLQRDLRWAMRRLLDGAS